MGTDAITSLARIPIVRMGAVAMRDRLASGALTAVQVVDAFLARIAEREAEVGAWAWIDPEFARAQAQHLDAQRRAGRPLGPLHGLPVGLKDIIDTAKIPTANGTALDADRVPAEDAWLVARLKEAGAIILGKTVTTELAFLHSSGTRNPHDLGHSPGGSSAGSAAAVADAMVPLAIGTQTGGSVIRPASYCGVTGFKPSFGAIPRRGVLAQAPSLDTVGVFAADPEGAALLAQVLFGHDPADRATTPQPVPGLLAAAQSEPLVAPVVAVIHPPGWDDAHSDMKDALGELVASLGEQAFEVDLPPAFSQAEAQRRTINLAEMAKFYYRYGRDGREHLSVEMRDALDEGNAIPARDYLAALDWKGCAERRAGRNLRPLRCDPDARGDRPRARGLCHHRQRDLQRALDPLRHARDHAADPVCLERPADGRAAYRTRRRRRPAVAHRPLALRPDPRSGKDPVMNRFLALITFVIFCGYVAILGYGVPSPDLIAVILLTVVLVAYDFITSSGPRDD